MGKLNQEHCFFPLDYKDKSNVSIIQRYCLIQREHVRISKYVSKQPFQNELSLSLSAKKELDADAKQQITVRYVSLSTAEVLSWLSKDTLV